MKKISWVIFWEGSISSAILFTHDIMGQNNKIKRIAIEAIDVFAKFDLVWN